MSDTAKPDPLHDAPPDDPTVVLNRLAQLSLALIPAFVAALAAIGGATGGLARLLRDETRVAVAAMGLILLSVALAALARAVSTTPGPPGSSPRLVVRPGVKAVLLLGSGILLFTGLFIAVTAQIGVMGTSQAPQIAGSVERSGDDVVVRGVVQASGVRSVDRITIYSYQTDDDAESANMPALYQSSSGPDANGVVNVPLQAARAHRAGLAAPGRHHRGARRGPAQLRRPSRPGQHREHRRAQGRVRRPPAALTRTGRRQDPGAGREPLSVLLPTTGTNRQSNEPSGCSESESQP